MSKLIRLVLPLMAALAGVPARAEAPALPAMGHVAASPALWTVHGRGGSMAYLFGSIHLVPKQLDWRSASIARAMQRSDTFVFEVMLNDATSHAVAAYMQEQGTLPPGMSLRAMLSPQAKSDFDAALVLTKLRLEDVDQLRPWLASITFDMADMIQRNYEPGGVDKQIFSWAVREGKNVEAFATVEQQLEFLAPAETRLEMEGFEVELKDLKNASNNLGPMVQAWARGDVDTVERISTAEMSKYPSVEKAVFIDRNESWVRQIRGMLSRKPRIFFIVVGAAHLAGRNGVPALLRKAGYQVDGP
jgi:uncharacterized protein YbaP (TraB family)